MENIQPELTKAPTAPKGLKTKDIKALFRAGMSKHDIAAKYETTTTSVNYHLNKRRAPKSIEPVVKSATAKSSEFLFSVNLFGVDIKLQQKPTAIIQSENSIVIK